MAGGHPAAVPATGIGCAYFDIVGLHGSHPVFKATRAPVTCGGTGYLSGIGAPTFGSVFKEDVPGAQQRSGIGARALARISPFGS